MSNSLHGKEAKSAKLFINVKAKRFILQKVTGRTKEAATPSREPT